MSPSYKNMRLHARQKQSSPYHASQYKTHGNKTDIKDRLIYHSFNKLDFLFRIFYPDYFYQCKHTYQKRKTDNCRSRIFKYVLFCPCAYMPYDETRHIQYGKFVKYPFNFIIIHKNNHKNQLS